MKALFTYQHDIEQYWINIHVLCVILEYDLYSFWIVNIWLDSYDSYDSMQSYCGNI